jgi:hypothetical protein
MMKKQLNKQPDVDKNLDLQMVFGKARSYNG